MASKCRKFVPNMFNKSKCQACFGSKEAHSAAALESNKASRKVSKCGYLFVSPDFDFSNPLDRTRRWQRRFFRLFDDGELTYSVDEAPDTVPQGSVDMNKCTEILDAEVITTHPNSIAVVTPEKTEYFKADSKEEIQWWHDVLIEYPNARQSVKPRRRPNYISNKENVQPPQDEGGNKEVVQSRFEVEKVRQPKPQTDLPAYATFKGVRSLKHKYDKNYQEGMRKSSSLHDLSSEDKTSMASALASTRFLSCSGDQLDVLSSGGGGGSKGGSRFPTNPYFTIPRTSWPSRVHPSGPVLTAPAAHPSLFNSSSSISSTSSTNSATRRGSFDDRSPSGAKSPSSSTSKDRSRHSRERSASLKDFPTHLTLPKELGSTQDSVERRAASVAGVAGLRGEGDDLSQSMSADETDSNETDELKDLVYMKKGWLIKQGPSDRESKKHWFVLAGNSLRYYKDAKAEESNNLDGRIDLSTCYEVSEITTPRNYGFKIKTRNGEYILAAMTSGIRNNWMKAVRLCMDLHSSAPKLGLSTSLTGKALAGLTARTMDDFDVGGVSVSGGASAATPTTTVVTGSKGETAFQLVGRRDPSKKESGRNVRRHHSDVNPGNVGKMFSVKEFTANLEPVDPLASSSGSSVSDTQQTSTPVLSDADSEKAESSPRASKIPRHHSPSADSLLWPSSGGAPMKRYVEGSDSMAVTPSSQAAESRRSKRNITSESSKEEEKREMMRRAKSPSARIKEKSRGAKTPRLHSPPPDEDNYEHQRSSGTGRSADTSQVLSDTEDDMDMTISSEERYDDGGGQDATDGTHSDSIGDGMLVEILESEVESLKERLDHTQNQLVKMHETNIDLKSRLQKESSHSQGLDTSYGSGRWGQQGSSQIDPTQVQTLKRQLKEAKDTVQKQRMEIESLKSKLDMSVSKLTGTEKALSEALREYKQEKDKFLKLSSEWNRRIRTLEGQVKDSTLKLERTRETMLAKERECRRLETEVKQNQQKTREQEREILKLKAVEHEYNQIKERLDNKERDLLSAHAELRERDAHEEKIKSEFDQQVVEMEREFTRERDDLENHLEELKEQLRCSQERQTTMQDNITTNMADLLGEKDDIISQLEEKLIENDRKMVDMQEELQAEMSENSELIHNLESLQEEKQNLQEQMEAVEKHVVSLKEKVASFEKDNAVLRQQLEKLKQENSQLSTRLSQTPSSTPSSDAEKEELQKTIQDLNKQVQGLQLKLMEKFEDFDQTKAGAADHDSDLLQSILIFDSELKEVNTLLMQLHERFTAYLNTVSGPAQEEVSSLAEMVDEIGHRCLMLHETLQEGAHGSLPDESGADYQHQISVTPASSSQAIMDEYRGLKGKFDRVVAELKKLKKEVNEVYSSYDELERKDKQLEEQMKKMEGSYCSQVENLVQRVEQLSTQLATSHSTAALQARLDKQPQAAQSTDVNKEIEQQLTQLDSKINMMEKALADAGKTASPKTESSAASRLSLSPQDSQAIVGRLKEMKQQLETTNSELKDIIGELPSNPSTSSHQQALVSRIDGCGQKLDKLSDLIQDDGGGSAGSPQRHVSGSSLPASDNSDNVCRNGSGNCGEESASSMAKCMREIKERIQEIGELLDSIEDESEDSDDEEGESCSIDDVRERLGSLCEYVKEHSQFSEYDWRLTQLLTAQKLAISKEKEEASSGGDRNKLQDYADRLSLESLILVEMAHLLENKELSDEDEDPVVREVSVLNSKVLSLQQKLDQELRTLCVEGPKPDVLKVQAELMAEKILVEGQLCASAFAQDSHLSESEAKEEEEKKLQPKLLALEAIMRSQLDSYIGQNLDKTCDEMWSSASHLTTRALVQGEVTFALNNLKKKLASSPQITESISGVRDFSFECLKQRHKQVLEVAEVYQEKMIQALAIIISKESEEMTIVEGPENVLEAVCSELSTIMERHIQRYKEKVRTARDTQSAHRWNMMVDQLRADREGILTGIQKQHEEYARDTDSVDGEAVNTASVSGIEIPFQSLDSSINNFGEVASLRSILCAQMNFVSELLRMGDTDLLEEMSADDAVEESEEEEADKALQKGLSSFVHSLAEGLQAEAKSKQAQAAALLGGDQAAMATSLPDVPHPRSLTTYSDTLVREAVFAAQTTFMMYKLKLLHEQEMEALKAARPARVRPQVSSEGSQDSEGDLYTLLVPMEEVLDTKFDDEMETLRVIASQVSKLQGALGSHDWGQISEHVQQLEQKVQAELDLAQQRHEVHLDLFKQEENKVEHAWEEIQQEREHFEERCTALETELRSMSSQHDDEVERMRQDVLTAVSAIRASEEESETQLSDKVQELTKQMLLQKEKYKRFLNKMKGELSGADEQSLQQMVTKELKEIDETAELSEDEELPPLPSRPPPDVAHGEDKGNLHVEEELELLKKEKDEALAEETRNTKAALDAMRKAYEGELQQERDKYREMLTTMYNEDFVNEIRRRHQVELEKTQEELKQVKMHYMSKCEDYKLLEVKMGQTKQDYESHINQLIRSNDHLDDMVNQEIERLKDFIKNRPANLTTGSATIEEELYDAQIMIRVKDAELQKLRSQVKNLENSLHRTTEEHRQTMTQYLQALKENQEQRKEYQAETNSLREQLDKALNESGLRRPIRRTPSFHQRARSPSPQTSIPHRRDSASASTDHVSRESNRRRRIEPKDLRRSKSSPSLPYVFDAKGMPTSLKSTGKGGRQSQSPKV